METHLVITEAGKETIGFETTKKIEEVEKLAHHVHDNQDLMLPLPAALFALRHDRYSLQCEDLSGLANSFNLNLLLRAGDVTLKEKRKLCVVFGKHLFTLVIFAF